MRFDFFYSDPHFGHSKIIEYCNRPFRDVEHQTETLIQRYNNVVRPDQTVLWLGDCFFRHSDVEQTVLLSKLNGKKCLVAGNHDRASRRMAKVGFEFVVKQLVWEQDGYVFRGSHFPWKNMMFDEGNLTRYADERFPKWHPKYNKDEVLVHGHTHDTRQHNGGTAVHCGVDAWSYGPVPIRYVHDILHQNGLSGISQ